MEIPSINTQTSAIQAYTVQQQDRRRNDESEEITRREAENAQAAQQPGERVTLSRESRDAAVQEADKSRRSDESRQREEVRAQEERQTRAANTPRSITQALEAYTRTALI